MALLKQRTYEIVKAPSKAWSWGRYKNVLSKKWRNLLNNQHEYQEKDFQEFFELHPCMLPWLYGEIGRGAHGMFPNALITQPVLPGLSSKIPDFMWIASDSGSVFVVMIEIENPNKPWATQSGQPSSDLTQAINQLKDWQSWFSDPINEERFKKDYRIPSFLLESHSFEKVYLLIHGRRSDSTLTNSFNKKRALLQNHNEIFMTYDRLKPNRELDDCLTVKISGDGYDALHIQPTLQLGPMNADDRSYIRNKNEAVNRNIYLSDARKKFLNSRWQYWDSWARNGNHGMIAHGDFE